MSALNTAMFGVMTANSHYDQVAQKTIRDVSQGKDVVSDFVEQMEARIALQANITVAKTADDMTGKVLNLKV